MSDYPDFTIGTLYKAIRADRKEWTVGWYMQKYDVFGVLEHFIFFSEKASKWEYAPINADTLCRYTGYTDAFDNDIWEHDIVETDDHLNGEVLFGEHGTEIGWYIQWKDKEAEYYRQDFGYWVHKAIIKVIGNIFFEKETIHGFNKQSDKSDQGSC